MSWNDYLSAIGIGPTYSMPTVDPNLAAYIKQQFPSLTQGGALSPPSTSGGTTPQAPTASQVFANAAQSGGLASPSVGGGNTPQVSSTPVTPGTQMQPSGSPSSVVPAPVTPPQQNTQPPQDLLNGLSPIQADIAQRLKAMGNPDVSHAIPLGNGQIMGIDGTIMGPTNDGDRGGPRTGVISLPSALNPSPFNQQSLAPALGNFAFTPQTPPPSWKPTPGSNQSQGPGEPGQGLMAFLGSLNQGGMQ